MDIREYERKRASRAVMDLFFTLKDIKGTPTLKDLVKLAKRIKKPGVGANWSDDSFPFADVSQAAYEIGEFCKRWGRISVSQTKEKYGTARVYCNFGLYNIHSITHPGYHYNQYPQWLMELDNCMTVPVFNLLQVSRWVTRYQIYIYRKAYKRAITKFPHIKDEIICGADAQEYLKDL